MKKTNHLENENLDLNHFLNLIKPILFISFFLLSIQIFAQQGTKPKSFGIHAGINSGTLSGGTGPSFSLHYAFPSEKALQLESMLFYDSHSGKTFLTGHYQENIGFGLAAGARINFLPQKNWNPSVLIMPGIIYSSETTTRYDGYGSSGISDALCLAFSNAFFRKHMISLGLNRGENIFAAYLKYGFWF